MKKSLSHFYRFFAATLCVFLLFPVGAYAATHTVSPGESLYTIGKMYGTSADRLSKLNGISNNVIYPGQKITIPDKTGTVKSEPGTTGTMAGNGAYTVKNGDTLYGIALKYGTTYDAIIRVNGLKSSAIYPGQVLMIPSSKSSVGTSPTEVSRGMFYKDKVSYNRSDFDLLARLITAEADSESYKTQVAVGAVVLNRVKSSLFPNTIPEVIYQVENGSYQFEPVLNGWINRPASESAMKAAREALSGVDPTNGSLYFFESWVTNKYLKSRPVSMVMDSFTFTY